MDVPELKSRHDWCQHARPGHGCAIHRTRPNICREFYCQWLLDEAHPDYWKPNKSKIIIDIKVHDGKKIVVLTVDPAYPSRWREEPYFSDIKHIAKAGIEGRLGVKWTTVVLIKDEKIPIIGSERLLRPLVTAS